MSRGIIVKLTGFCASVLILLSNGLAQRVTAAEFEALFEFHVHKDAAGHKLPYRLMKPANYKADGSVKYPLVLFLHGAGERGSDNVLTLIHGMRDFAKAETRTKYPCFVVVPQCSDGKRWVEVDWSKDSHQQLPDDSESMKLVLELLTTLQHTYQIDDRRLYATGLSMGGYGVWDLITRYPDKFAAAAPICGGGDEAVAARAAKVPVWAFHGDSDTAVKPERSRNMINALIKAGGQPIYTEYIGVGHDSWSRAYSDPRLMEWMFAQHR